MLRLVLATWAEIPLRRRLVSVEDENERLHAMLGRQTRSIWNMRRPEMEKVAREELDMTESELQRHTVGQLRYLVKVARDKAKLDDMEGR